MMFLVPIAPATQGAVMYVRRECSWHTAHLYFRVKECTEGNKYDCMLCMWCVLYFQLHQIMDRPVSWTSLLLVWTNEQSCVICRLGLSLGYRDDYYGLCYFPSTLNARLPSPDWPFGQVRVYRLEELQGGFCIKSHCARHPLNDREALASLMHTSNEKLQQPRNSWKGCKQVEAVKF